jgi:hypothetical protein
MLSTVDILTLPLTVATVSIFGTPHKNESLTHSCGYQLKTPCPPRPPPRPSNRHRSRPHSSSPAFVARFSDIFNDRQPSCYTPTKLASIFATVINAQPTPSSAPTPTPPPSFPALTRLAPAPTLPPGFPALPIVTQAPTVVPFQSVAPAPPVPTDPSPRVLPLSPVQTDVPPVPPIVPPVLPAVTYQHRTSNARSRRRRTNTAEKKATAATKVAATEAATEKAAAESTTQPQQKSRSRPRSQTTGGVTATIHTANLSTQLIYFSHSTNTVIGPATGVSLE